MRIRQEKNSHWYKHFKNIIGRPDNQGPIQPIFDEVDIDVAQFTTTEYKEAKWAIMEGKWNMT